MSAWKEWQLALANDDISEEERENAEPEEELAPLSAEYEEFLRVAHKRRRR